MVCGTLFLQRGNGVPHLVPEVEAGASISGHHGHDAVGVVHQELEREGSAAHILEDAECSSVAGAWGALEVTLEECDRELLWMSRECGES